MKHQALRQAVLGAALAALCQVAGCTNMVKPMSALMPGSAVDDVPGKFIASVDISKIDYSTQSKERLALADHKDKRSYPAETYIGPVDHSRINDKQTVIYDKDVEAFVQQIIANLLEHWQGPRPNLRVAFVVDSDDAQFQAESGSDGTMYFGLSAIRDVESTDELAFITAHELSHVLLNHTARVKDQKKIEEASQEAAATSLIANGYVNRALPNNGAQTNSKIVMGLEGFDILLNKVLCPAFSRQQEREADLMGADLMIQAGYSPRAIDYVMQRLADQDRKAEAAKEQVRAAQQAARDEQARRQAGMRQGQTQTVALPGKLTGLFSSKVESWFDQIGSDHPRAEDRDDDLVMYVRREYSEQLHTNRTTRDEEYQQFKLRVSRGPLMRRQFALMSTQLLDAGRLDEAYAMAKHSLSGDDDPAAEPRLAMYKICVAQYDKTHRQRYRDEGVHNLEIAWKGPEAYADIGVTLASEYTRAKRYDAADDLLSQAGSRFGEERAVLPAKVANWSAAGRKEKAFATAYDCREQGGHGLRLQNACETALQPQWHDEYLAYADQHDQEKAAAEAAARKAKGEDKGEDKDKGPPAGKAADPAPSPAPAAPAEGGAADQPSGGLL